MIRSSKSDTHSLPVFDHGKEGRSEEITRVKPSVLAQLGLAGTVDRWLGRGLADEHPPLTTGSAKMDDGDDVDFRRVVCFCGLVEC